MNFDVAKLDKRVKFSEQIIKDLKSNDCNRGKKRNNSRKLFPANNPVHSLSHQFTRYFCQPVNRLIVNGYIKD